MTFYLCSFPVEHILSDYIYHNTEVLHFTLIFVAMMFILPNSSVFINFIFVLPPFSASLELGGLWYSGLHSLVYPNFSC